MAIHYEWQTIRFEGSTVEEATQAFDRWFGYGQEEFSLTKQSIRRKSDGSLHLYVNHVPHPHGHEIYVTALMQTLELP